MGVENLMQEMNFDTKLTTVTIKGPSTNQMHLIYTIDQSDAFDIYD
jgi:hypothetical protein